MAFVLQLDHYAPGCQMTTEREDMWFRDEFGKQNKNITDSIKSNLLLMQFHVYSFLFIMVFNRYTIFLGFSAANIFTNISNE